MEAICFQTLLVSYRGDMIEILTACKYRYSINPADGRITWNCQQVVPLGFRSLKLQLTTTDAPKMLPGHSRKPSQKRMLSLICLLFLTVFAVFSGQMIDPDAPAQKIITVRKVGTVINPAIIDAPIEIASIASAENVPALQIEATGDTWIELRIDHAIFAEGYRLASGEVLRFEGDVFRLTVGDPSQIKVIYTGETIELSKKSMLIGTTELASR